MSYPKMLRFTFDTCAFACFTVSAVAWGHGYNEFLIPFFLCGGGLALSIVCHNVHGE